MSKQLATRASKLSVSQWQSVFKAMQASARKDLEKAINKVDKSKPQKKESSRKPTKKSNKDNPIFATDQSRRGNYRFGKSKIPFYKPTEGYPSKNESNSNVEGSLELEHVYGFKGTTNQNLIYRNGKLLYFLAAVGIVHNVSDGTQQFFTEHNDDLTSICVDPRDGQTMAATAQKDPKDTPGQGKDLPKIYIWNYETMETVAEISKVCEQSILRVQWSKASGWLYMIGKDKNQSLKAYDTRELKGKALNKKQVAKLCEAKLDTPSTSDPIVGFSIRPTACENGVDELVFFCHNKILFTTITEKNGKLIMGKPQAVKIKGKEKAFLCCEWLNNGNFIVGSTGGNLYICKQKEVIKVHKKIHGEKRIGDIILLDDNKTLITTGYDKTVRKFELNEDGSELNETYNSEAIKIEDSDFVMLPKAMAYDGEGTIFAGTKSNQIISFGLESKEAKLLIDGHDGEIHAVCCHPTEDIFVTGGWDRAVKAWDPSTFTCTKTYEFPKMNSDEAKEQELHKDKWQMTSSCFTPDGKYIVVATEMSGLAVIDYETFSLQYSHQIPKANKNQKELEGIAYVRFSPCGKYLAVAHMDAHLYIFTLIDKEGKVKLSPWKKPMKHRAAPSNLQWSVDSKFVKCLTRDYEVAHWELDFKSKKGTFCVKIPDPDKLEWANDPLIAGWDVQGLYQSDWDGTDLNDCCLTSDKKYIFSGDDYGTVRMHNYPAINPKKNKEYSGHAEFVQGVELLQSDSHLLTVGGADRSIFQWKVNKE